MGQKATSRHTKKNSRFRGLSSRPMSAFLAEGDFVPSLPAHPLRADATADPSFGRLVAICGHPIRRLQANLNDQNRPISVVQVCGRERRISVRKAVVQ